MVRKVNTFEAQCDKCNLKVRFESFFNYVLPEGWKNDKIGYECCPDCVIKEGKSESSSSH